MTLASGRRAAGTALGLVALACIAARGRAPDALPAFAEIVYHQSGEIWTMDAQGGNATRLTNGPSRVWEHAAVSPDHRFVAGDAMAGGVAQLWIVDVATKAQTRLLPSFAIAGDGGVDWDDEGRIYFVGRESAAQPLKDLYRVFPDGSGLERLTNTPGVEECDPSVAGDRVLYCLAVPDPGRNAVFLEIWDSALDGSDARRVLVGGDARVASVHDPEGETGHVVFSRVNSDVPPNFPGTPFANTAHDIMVLEGGVTERLTAPGAISIIPDIRNGLVLYTEASEQADYSGAAIVTVTGRDQVPLRIRRNASAAKWIP
jgi:hypothetical protein